MPVDQGNGQVGHGKGLQPSPPDPRDYQLSTLMAVTPELLAALPSSYIVPNAPPVLNQGNTPQCVAYSASSMKAWQDKIDQGVWFDFNEPYFFNLIGGTPTGAYLRAAMDRMRNYGYPVVNNTTPESSHKIASYYAAGLTGDTLRAAIYTYGPIIVGFHWYDSWSTPKSNGQVPAPSGVRAGHAITAIGWDSRGIRFRNSWGKYWGPIGGDCFIPEAYLQYAFEAWKSIDVDMPPVPSPWAGRALTVSGKYTPNSSCNIRSKPDLLASSIWARTYADGYTYRIVNGVKGAKLWSNLSQFAFNGEYVGDFAKVRTGAGQILYIHKTILWIVKQP